MALKSRSLVLILNGPKNKRSTYNMIFIAFHNPSRMIKKLPLYRALVRGCEIAPPLFDILLNKNG